MKQTLAMLFVTALLLFSLAGCGEKKDSNTANGPSTGTTDNGAGDRGKKKDNMPGDDMSGDRADQNDRREERAQEANHGVEDLPSAEGRAVQRDLVRDAVDTDDAGDEDAACDGRDGHHHGVGQKIEEVQKLHADHGDICQRAIAQTGEAAEENHRDAHDARGLSAAPVQLILQGRDGTFRQRDGTRQRGEQH